MMTRGVVAGTIFFISMAVGHGVLGQTRPATSGAVSFYEPEPRPHAEGWYRPNVPGSPRVGSEVERSDVPPVRVPR